MNEQTFVLLVMLFYVFCIGVAVGVIIKGQEYHQALELAAECDQQWMKGYEWG